MIVLVPLDIPSINPKFNGFERNLVLPCRLLILLLTDRLNTWQNLHQHQEHCRACRGGAQIRVQIPPAAARANRARSLMPLALAAARDRALALGRALIARTKADHAVDRAPVLGRDLARVRDPAPAAALHLTLGRAQRLLSHPSARRWSASRPSRQHNRLLPSLLQLAPPGLPLWR